MTSEITTDNIQDLLEIFDPKVQENDDTGGARILYTFIDEELKRERVGETFTIHVNEPQVSFFVFLPVVSAIQEGIIYPLQSAAGINSRYSLSKKDLEKLISDVLFAFGYDEDKVVELLEE